MADGPRSLGLARRAAGSALRLLRVSAGRFVEPTFDVRTTALEERLETVGRMVVGGAGRTTALEERLEAVGRLAMDGAGRTTALEERLEAVGRLASDGAGRTTALEERLEATTTESRADISQRVADLWSSLAADRLAMRRQFTNDIERTRSRMAVPDGELVALEEFRSSPDYARIYEAAEPLVSVTVATYNRAELLVQRCLRSIIEQDYTNLEIIVVGDGCTDDTEARVRDIGDERIRYVELVERTIPAALGGGTDALNLARSLATGDLLTHLDDDDEYVPDRVGRLVRFLQDTRAEFVWHPFWWQESAEAEWIVNEAEALEHSKVTSGAVLYLRWFERVRMDAWTRRYREPGDWALFRTLRDIGIKTRRYPVPLLRHHLERQNPRRLAAANDGRAPTTATALRRVMPLVPEVGSLSEYEELLGEVSPWARAVGEIGAAVGLRTNGALRAVVGDELPTLTTAHGHVFRLYGPWRDGPTAFGRDVRALQLAGRVSGNLVPMLHAQGALTDEWSYVVTTEVPGVGLSTVWDELSHPDLIGVAGWVAGVVRGLHATPLSAQERMDGWGTFCAAVSERHAVIQRDPADSLAMPPHLLAEMSDWLPPLTDLLPSEAHAVVLHRDLRAEKVRGVWHGGRFDATGLSDPGKAQIGHPYHELGPMCSGLFDANVALLQGFLQAMGWAETDQSDFPKLALAFVLLDTVDHLNGLPMLEKADDLDDLAARLFGSAPDEPRASP